ncbi:DUF3152 domain-containing protein [Actinoplanes sp. NPDC051861]|uniref:DUF3152 domain-containing protein n=1 Tax=Actinoplanes sp. NPDC051861 TaxID=3155170 RepID=UPI0034417AD7
MITVPAEAGEAPGRRSRAGARKTTAEEPAPVKRTRAKAAAETVEKPATTRRRTAAKAAPKKATPPADDAAAKKPVRRAPARKTAATPEPPAPPAPVGELTSRGIVELAAERLAASAPRTAENVDEPPATPVRRPSRSRPATHRQPFDPPRVESRPEPFTWATAGTGETPVVERATDEYPRTPNRPPGLPASLRLPVELPENVWPPRSLMERNSIENLYVPAASPQHRAEEFEAATTEEIPEARLYVPPPPAERPEPSHPPTEAESEEHENAFLPTVLSRGDDDYVPAHSRTETVAKHAAPVTVSARTLRRRRRAVLLAYILLVVLVLVIGHRLRDDEQPIAPAREAAQRAAEPAGVGPAANVPAATPKAQAGETQAEKEPAETGKAGEFGYAKSRGPMLGEAGRLHRFKVAVEKSLDGPSAAEFAERIDETLDDERSWVNDGRLRMRRVSGSAGNADFTIYLASPRTSEQMCATGGLQTAGFTSCRVPGKVIINSERWREAVPDYVGHLEEYRRYAINHEVGHELGHGHEQCPGEGAKAPVMMPQTYGLKGCTRNAWPYLDGKRYAGEPMA